jgi:BlaI family transcriptional regulator, penicillinase repressor
MEILYSLGSKATLSAVLEKMQNPPTRPALRSLLNILEEKGHLKHSKQGREFLYEPVQSTAKVAQSTLSRVLSTFFNGSLTQALSSYLSDPRTKFTESEIQELTAFVEEAKTRSKSKKPR